MPLFFFILLSIPFAFSLDLPRSCERAGIASLRFEELPQFDGGREYCSSRPHALTERSSRKPRVDDLEVEKFLLQLGSLNDRLAEKFHVPFEDLVSAKLKIVVRPQFLGPLGSASSKFFISLGVFPSWRGEKFPEGIYLHELAHFMNMNPGKILPPAIKTFLENIFLSETLADKLAHTVTQERGVFSKTEGAIQCMQGLRVSNYQTYAYPVGYYLSDFSNRRLIACCSSDTFKKNNQSKDWAFVCEKMIKRKSELSPLNLTPLKDLGVQGLEELPFDKHQIGLPLGSFLINLQQKVSINVDEALFQGLREVDGQKKTRKYDCAWGGKSQTVEQYSIVPILQFVKEKLSPSEAEEFQKLFKKHALYKMRNIETIAHVNAARLVSAPLLMKDIPLGHECRKVVVESQSHHYVKIEGCEISCKLTK